MKVRQPTSNVLSIGKPRTKREGWCSHIAFFLPKPIQNQFRGFSRIFFSRNHSNYFPKIPRSSAWHFISNEGRLFFFFHQQFPTSLGVFWKKKLHVLDSQHLRILSKFLSIFFRIPSEIYSKLPLVIILELPLEFGWNSSWKSHRISLVNLSELRFEFLKKIAYNSFTISLGIQSLLLLFQNFS